MLFSEADVLKGTVVDLLLKSRFNCEAPNFFMKYEHNHVPCQILAAQCYSPFWPSERLENRFVAI
jgi:hypothetical protein